MMPIYGLPKLEGPRDANRIYGVVVGIVTNNKDPQGMARVKVKLPALSDDYETQWARLVTPMAGNDRGLYYLPEVNDEVLVAFEDGIIERPFVLGAVWNGKDKPPESNSDGQNNMRTTKSRSGHIIRLDDTAGGEKVQIIDKTGNNLMVISSSDNTIHISANSDITIESKTGKLKMSAVGVEITSTTDVKIQANATIDIQATGQTSIQGALVKLN
jgi:phage baseplate assembly protein V